MKAHARTARQSARRREARPPSDRTTAMPARRKLTPPRVTKAGSAQLLQDRHAVETFTAARIRRRAEVDPAKVRAIALEHRDVRETNRRAVDGRHAPDDDAPERPDRVAVAVVATYRRRRDRGDEQRRNRRPPRSAERDPKRDARGRLSLSSHRAPTQRPSCWLVVAP